MIKRIKKLPWKIGLRVVTGILATIALMFALTLAGISYMAQVNQRMKDIVGNHNVKTEMAHIIQNAIRERALNMYAIAMQEDPFIKDEEFQRFNSFGLAYNQAYQSLESLASTAEEKAILANIHALTRTAQHDVQEVMDVLLGDKKIKQYEAIQRRIMPNQKKINEQVTELVSLQKKQAMTALGEAESSYEFARKFMLLLGVLASVLVIFISLMVSRKVAKQAQDIEYQALHDELTTLPNRMLFLDRLAHAISLSQRENLPFAILLLDLDRFKDVNETLGHHMGDQLLQEVSCKLCAAVRESDTIARLGGDEFVILLERVDLDHAPLVAEKILKILENPFVLDGQVVDVSASIGIAGFPEHGDDSVTLLQKADVAMYAAKRNFSGYEIFSGAMVEGIRIDLAFKSDLLHAIECDELVLYYQPKIDFSTGKVTSVEALVRWQHPQRGFLSPDVFIPLTEQNGLINQLTFWVLKKALHQCMAFRNAGVDITVAVNLSARSLNDIRVPGEIARMLANAKIRPDMLVLEITEGAVMSNPVEALNVLRILDRMGISLSIDDFGTGYSSLSYLSKLPVDEIKIDKSFVLGMVQDPHAAVIVRSTIELGHNLGKKIVAEGVETLEMWDLLADWGCDTAQGYYMSKPLPADKLMLWLAESEWA